MKKINLLIAFLAIGMIANAQFTVHDSLSKMCLERDHVKTGEYSLSITEDRYLVNVDDYSYWELKKPFEKHYTCGRCGELIVEKTYERDTVWRRLITDAQFNRHPYIGTPYIGIPNWVYESDTTLITQITLEDWNEYYEWYSKKIDIWRHKNPPFKGFMDWMKNK